MAGDRSMFRSPDSAGAPSAGRSTSEMLVELYDELHQLARQWFQRQPGPHTLQPTALVHEAFLRLAGRQERWSSRTHFYALAATAMRQILIDHARRRLATKRGRSWARITLEEAAQIPAAAARSVDLLALDEALQRLERLSPRQCRIVELRYLAGLSVEETAAAIGLSARTVKLEWRMARAWLTAELGDS